MAESQPVERQAPASAKGRAARKTHTSSRRVERLAALALRSKSAEQDYDVLRARYRALAQEYARAVERARQLTEKYSAAVDALRRLASEESGLRMLAVWALRKTADGLALVQGDRIRLTNLAFVALEQAASGERRWARVATEESADEHWVSAYPELRSLVSGEVRRCLGATRTPYRARFARGAQIVSVSIERSDLLGSSFALVVVRDETDLAEARAAALAMEEKFIQQERVRTLGGLAMGIVHDLNNVLGSLAMRFDMLQRETVYRESQKRNLDLMNQIICSCTARVRALHSLVRSPDPSPTKVDLAEVVRSAVEIVESGFLHGTGSSDLVRVEIALPELPRVNGSADELRHVFINLLVNARDAMKKGGTIQVTGSHLEGSVRVVFEDEGPGIPPEHLERIFEPLFTTKGADGSGVGLAIARETLEKFGGSIRAHNASSGGARFELRFSAAIDPGLGANADGSLGWTR